MITLLLISAGFVCGAVNSVAGGGVLLVYPVYLFAGLSPLNATITLYASVFPGSLSAAYANRNDLSKVPKKYFFLVIPTFLGAIVGFSALSKTNAETFERIVPWLILSAVMLFVFQPQLHKHLKRPPHMRFGSPLFLVGIGLFFVSIYGGYFGAGFGFLMLALLGFTKIHGIFRITALKNLMASIIGMTGTVYFTFAGGINWNFAIVTAIGTILGGFFGARYFHKISPHTVRGVVGVVGTAVAIFAFIKL